MKKAFIYIAVVAAIITAYILSAFEPLDRGLTSLRFRLLEKPASGDIVVVGIDTKSLQELNVWPWPREYHAALAKTLMSAGAARIAFDIDFSSYSNPKSDEAFATVLKQAEGQIMLATFKQPVISENGEKTWVQTIPIPQFGRNAILGHVNVQVEKDSRVWRYSPNERMEGVRVPGMAAALAGRTGEQERAFTIDYGILPETLPYLSYTDVITGKFDPSVITGKSVIIGAVALELGDRIPVPIHQVLPGPVVQALIADTMVQNGGLSTANRYIVAAITFLTTLIFVIGPVRRSWKIGAVLLGVFGVTSFLVSLKLQSDLKLIAEISPVIVSALALYLMSLTRSIDRLTQAYRQELMESLYRRAMMGAVVDSGFDGIVISDGDGNIELLNPSGSTLLGKSQEEVRGQPVQNFLPTSPEIDALYSESEDGDRDDSGTIGPIELPLPGNSEIILEVVVSTARLAIKQRRGKPAQHRTVHIYTFRDITDRKKVEEAQRTAAEEARAANRAKTEFLHNMSHELRTPLNAIIGFSEMIKTEMLGPVGVPQYLEYIGDINASGSHLLQIVNDILDMSKIEARQMEVTDDLINLVDLIDSSTRIIDERAWTNKIKLETEIEEGLPYLLADERLLKQMLINLLSNAVKFTEEGGAVTVNAFKRENGGLALQVTDTGIGIDMSQIDIVLEPFKQADTSLAREYDGTGLGLPLVKSMVELHNGTLEIESALGEGSTFRLCFPPERSTFNPELVSDKAPDVLPPAIEIKEAS